MKNILVALAVSFGVVSSPSLYGQATRDDITDNSSLLIYPNPVISDTHIVLPNTPKTTVYVDLIDLNGNIVRSYKYDGGYMLNTMALQSPAGSYLLDVNMSDLPTSIYSVRVYSAELGSYNLKVVKE